MKVMYNIEEHFGMKRGCTINGIRNQVEIQAETLESLKMQMQTTNHCKVNILRLQHHPYFKE